MSILAAIVLTASLQQAEPVIEPFEPQGFSTRFTVEIDAPVSEVFDAATGDVTGWWDHSYWPDPAEMVIEPRFDGRFYERFEPGSDDGMLHARVIFVQAPNQLRLHGPLGLSGRAFDMVTSWTLAEMQTETGSATRFTVDLRMAGEVDAEVAGAVRSVWLHFIDGRLKPWVEAGCHRQLNEPCDAFEARP